MDTSIPGHRIAWSEVFKFIYDNNIVYTDAFIFCISPPIPNLEDKCTLIIDKSDIVTIATMSKYFKHINNMIDNSLIKVYVNPEFVSQNTKILYTQIDLVDISKTNAYFKFNINNLTVTNVQREKYTTKSISMQALLNSDNKSNESILWTANQSMPIRQQADIVLQLMIKYPLEITFELYNTIEDIINTNKRFRNFNVYTSLKNKNEYECKIGCDDRNIYSLCGISLLGYP